MCLEEPFRSILRFFLCPYRVPIVPDFTAAINDGGRMRKQNADVPPHISHAGWQGMRWWRRTRRRRRRGKVGGMFNCRDVSSSFKCVFARSRVRSLTPARSCHRCCGLTTERLVFGTLLFFCSRRRSLPQECTISLCECVCVCVKTCWMSG